MNTKQLWNALTHNPITNFYFDGIFSSDTLAFVKEPELIICNTDPSNKAGEHWVLFFVRGKSVDFYDSLGRDINYYGSLFLDFIKNLLMIINNVLEGPNRLTVICVDIIVCIMLLLNVMVILWKQSLIAWFHLMM